MAAAEFCATLAALDLAQCRVARWFSINVRSVRRWQRGDRRIPAGVSIIFGLLAARTITADQIQQAAAVLIPPRTNGDPKPTPPAPRPVEPVPEQSASVPPVTDPSPATLAEKVCGLTAEVCHWPLGDPRHPNFRFCSRPTAAPPYCNEHRIAAHMTAPIRGPQPRAPPTPPP